MQLLKQLLEDPWHSGGNADDIDDKYLPRRASKHLYRGYTIRKNKETGSCMVRAQGINLCVDVSFDEAKAYIDDMRDRLARK